VDVAAGCFTLIASFRMNAAALAKHKSAETQAPPQAEEPYHAIARGESAPQVYRRGPPLSSSRWRLLEYAAECRRGACGRRSLSITCRPMNSNPQLSSCAHPMERP
jgi:hypothetical protein